MTPDTHHPIRWIALGLLAGVLALLFLCTPRARGAGLLIADGGFGGQLEQVSHDVDVTINNGIAVTTVEQVFHNLENRQVEALYTFPVPKQASVANFSMWIDGKEMIGEVVEKQRAREIYESYKRTRRDPGLLEQVDYKTFEMRIFPIAANAEQRVRITYYQQLDVDHDRATYVYPLATAARSGLDDQVQGRFSLDVRVLSEVPIVAMDSPSHGSDMLIADHSPKLHEASLELAGGRVARDVVLSYAMSRPQTGLDLITSRAEGEDGYFMLTLTAGEELARFDRAMDYVFVLDISGSMGQDGKLLVSKDAVSAFLDGLGPDDRFEVITFNVKPELAFGELRDADEAGLTAAKQFLGTARARGGTTLGPALSTAYKYADADRPLNVIVLSDGMTEQQERLQLLHLIRQRPAGAKVFCIGVGNEVNRPLLSQLADDAGGLAAFLSRGDDFQRQASAFRRKLVRPVATNLNLAFDGVDVYDLEPGALPNLYHGAPVTVFGRYRGGGEATVRITGDVLGQRLNQAVPVDLSRGDGGNPEIERMWALKRIEGLLRDADRNGSRSGVVDEIIRLGEGYSIVTEYTSFIVLENDAEYRRWKIDRRNANRLARDRQQQEQLASRLDALREQAMASIGPEAAPTGRPTQTTDAAEPSARAREAEANPAASRRRDLNLPGFGGGGGAGPIDPVTGTLILVTGGASLLRRRRVA